MACYCDCLIPQPVETAEGAAICTECGERVRDELEATLAAVARGVAALNRRFARVEASLAEHANSNGSRPSQREVRADALHAEREPYLSVEQAADYIAGKPKRVYDLVESGRLRPHRDGRRLLFKHEDLDAALSVDREAGA